MLLQPSRSVGEAQPPLMHHGAHLNVLLPRARQATLFWNFLYLISQITAAQPANPQPTAMEIDQGKGLKEEWDKIKV